MPSLIQYFRLTNSQALELSYELDFWTSVFNYRGQIHIPPYWPKIILYAGRLRRYIYKIVFTRNIVHIV